MIWFTSDTHFGHARVIELCDRPFFDVNHMNWEIIKRWNEVVRPTDTVFHLGDVALGTIAESLPLVGYLNGYKILVPGNHDRVSSVESERRRERFLPEYLKVFQEVRDEVSDLGTYFGRPVLVSHYPYKGDHTANDRHVDLRPVDEGHALIHGHLHNPDLRAHGRSFHVGVDAHDFYPVGEDEIAAWLDTLDNQ